MDWILVNQSVQTCLSSVGSQIGDRYQPSDDCLSERIAKHCLDQLLTQNRDFLDALKEIYKHLLAEDKVSRTFRRVISFFQTLQKDFIPLLISTKDKKIADYLMRILVNLSIPVECLLPVEGVCLTEAGKITIFELNASLANAKCTFVDPRTTRAILDFLKALTTSDDVNNEKLTGEDCEFVNNSILLLRNVLHIPEPKTARTYSTVHNQILWNLFVQNIDKILIQLMTSDQRAHWGVAIVQLIAVIYKDQHIGTLQKLLNEFEGSLSESSEENESNTSLINRDHQCDSSPNIISSDPTSEDSSDYVVNQSPDVPHTPIRTAEAAKSHKKLTYEEIFKERKKNKENLEAKYSGKDVKKKVMNNKKAKDESDGLQKIQDEVVQDHTNCSELNTSLNCGTKSHRKRNIILKREPLSQDFSDCGYVSHIDTQGTVSTSSNEEEGPAKRPIHLKPHIVKTRYHNKQQSPQEKKEIRRKKLMKRGKTAIMNIKAIANHIPTDSDITHILKEFTVDFLLKGYKPLVKVLYDEILASKSSCIDTSHFFWLITYFLKFTAQLELELEHVRDVLSFSIISYLVYEGVNICERIELALQECSHELKSFLRRQHLVVTAIREFIQTVDAYSKLTHISEEDKEAIHNLQVQMYASNDLKCTFLLLLRHYKSDVHSKQYLEDLVVTNHILFTFLEDLKVDVNSDFTLSLHDVIKLFASADVIKHYGLLLEDFEKNGEFLNDCVLTMMHHVGGDINNVAYLCQPSILKTFTNIWESDFQLCDDWSDLIEYVIHRFVNIPRHCPVVGSLPEMPTVLRQPIIAPEDARWSKEECENLYWYFALSSTDCDLVANIIKLYEETGVIKTRIAVIERLKKQNVIDEQKYQELLKAETAHCEKEYVPASPNNTPISVKVDDNVTSLRDILIMDNRGEQLLYLQTLLLETCYVKLNLDPSCTEIFDLVNRPMLPIPFMYSTLEQSVPVVPWSNELATAMRKTAFRSLLRILGFHLPSESGQLFVRIPNFWTAEVLFSVAQKLGPIDFSRVKFDLERFTTTYVDWNYITKEIAKPKDGHHFAMPKPKRVLGLIKYTPLPHPSSSWLSIIKDYKRLGSRGDSDCDIEDLEVASVASMASVRESDQSTIVSQLGEDH